MCVKCVPIIWYSHSISRYLPKRSDSTCPHNYLHRNFAADILVIGKKENHPNDDQKLTRKINYIGYYSVITRIMTKWINLKRVLLIEISQTEKSTYSMIPFIWSSRKYKLIYVDRKQVSDSLGMAGEGERMEGHIILEHKNHFGGNVYLHYLYCDDGLMGVYRSKIIKSYINMCSFVQLFLLKSRVYLH